MATTLFFYTASGGPDDYWPWSASEEETKLDGNPGIFNSRALSTSRGTGSSSYTASSVSGPTNGVEATDTGPRPVAFITPPLAADVTISGTITLNLWGYENSMSANAALNCVIERLEPDGTKTEIAKSTNTAELGTSSAAQNFTTSPTSTDFKKGDRIRARVFFDDAGTMGAGYTLVFRGGAASSGVDGDSYVTFTETLSFVSSDPGGSTIYLTNTASDVSTSAVDREAWTSRGGGAQNDVTNTVTGFTSPVQVTDTAGGTVVDWWTRQLAAFTLSGSVLCHLRVAASSASSTSATLRVEIAVCDANGSNPVVWGSSTPGYEIGSLSEYAFSEFLVAGHDTAVANGKRLRIRLYLDDATFTYTGGAMVSGYTVTTYYAGTTGGASGDTYLIFPQTLTEYSGTTVPGSFTANAILRRVDQPGSFTTDATIVKPGEGLFTADAILLRTEDQQSFTVDAAVHKGGAGSLTVDSIVRSGASPVFAAVGISGGGVTSSESGQDDWLRRATVTGWAIAYADGLWVVVGYGGAIYTSTDGIVFTSRSSGVSSNLYCVAYGNGYWVVGGASGKILWSTNGIDWNSQTVSWAGANGFVDVAYGNGYWVGCIGQNQIGTATSPSGTWTERNPGFGTDNVRAAHYDVDDDIWVIAGTTGKLSTRSADPIGSWDAETSSFGSSQINDVWSGSDGFWVAVGDDNKIATATDPTGTWTQRTSPWGGSNSIDAVVHNPDLGLWAMSSASGKTVATTSDPTGTWANESIYGGAGAGLASLTWAPLVVPTFSIDAVVRKTQSQSFSVDAVIVSAGTFQGLLSADAIVRRLDQPGSLGADAIVRRLDQLGSFNASSILFGTVSGSFSVDAIINARFFIDAILLRVQESSFSASAWIYAPRQDPDGPGEPGETPMVSIMVGGLDITSDILLADAQFTMLVNGAVGSFKFRVRDDEHVHDFTSGAEVTLDIDGRRKFGGYLLKPSRGFAFPVQDTTDPDAVTRFWTLEGVDYNILFTKRVLYDKGDPASVGLRTWPAGSDDDDVIRYVFDHYTDLAADGATYLGVTHIGSPNPDKKGVIGSGGLTFGDAMREINRLLSGVYYFDQFKDLNFVDVDTPTASYGLSDNPGVGQVGYREFTQVENGARLANDAMVWGAGMGPRNIVAFAREQDAASIAAHGRWQYGEYTTSLYKQSSVNLRADTIVNGTPQSKRGGKDDQESWSVISFERSFAVGQKVAIESEVFGKSDVVPIRRYTVTFPVKNKPMFLLLLSHEIDLPWNLFEFWFPEWGIPEIKITDPPPPSPSEKTACIVAVCQSDHLDRTVAAPDWGGGWTTESSSADGGGVASQVANVADVATWVVTREAYTQGEEGDRRLDLSCSTSDPPWEYLIAWTADGRFDSYEVYNTRGTPPPGHVFLPAKTYSWGSLGYTVPRQAIDFWFENTAWSAELGNPTLLRVAMDLDDGAYWGMQGEAAFDAFREPLIPFSFVAGHTYAIRVRLSSTTIYVRMWDMADEEPASWDIIRAHSSDPEDLLPTKFNVKFWRGLQGGADDTGDPDHNTFTLPAVKVDVVCGGFLDPNVVQDPPTHGEWSEEMIGTGSKTVFVLPGAYVAGSTAVFVSGYLQRPGIEYTESSPGNGEITFSTAPADGAAIVVYYWSNGDYL